MKTILVLTDFSKNAKNAAEIAIGLAGKTGAGILLFNAYISPPLIPTAEYVAWPPEYYTAFKEESTVRLKKESQRLKELIVNHYGENSRITVSYSNAEGSLAKGTYKITRENDISLVIMGSRSKTTGDFMFGNDINEVISNINYPILLVPERRLKLEIKNIVFATDLEPGDIESIKQLLKLLKTFDFQIHICHISEPVRPDQDLDEEKRISDFTDQIVKLKTNNITYKNIEGFHIAKELEIFSRKIHADVLALVHKKHSIFWRIFHESPSRILVKHQKYPLLIFPQHLEKKSDLSAQENKSAVKKRKRTPIL